MITIESPKNWKHLQDKVGEILSQSGFCVEVEKKTKTARGEAELDVYAEERIKGRKYTVICECKLWNSKIPQSVIHGFRTIISDTGANKGYIISLKGFQSGSTKAANHTNLELITWQEFQNEFYETWVEKYFVPTMWEKLEPLLGYTDLFGQKWMCGIPDHEVEVVKSLREKYLPFAMIVMSCTNVQIFSKKDRFPVLQLSTDEKYAKEGLDAIPAAITEAIGYREFLNECIKYGQQGISEFREVRERNNV